MNALSSLLFKKGAGFCFFFGIPQQGIFFGFPRAGFPCIVGGLGLFVFRGVILFFETRRRNFLNSIQIGGNVLKLRSCGHLYILTFSPHFPHFV